MSNCLFFLCFRREDLSAGLRRKPYSLSHAHFYPPARIIKRQWRPQGLLRCFRKAPISEVSVVLRKMPLSLSMAAHLLHRRSISEVTPRELQYNTIGEERRVAERGQDRGRRFCRSRLRPRTAPAYQAKLQSEGRPHAPYNPCVCRNKPRLLLCNNLSVDRLTY